VEKQTCGANDANQLEEARFGGIPTEVVGAVGREAQKRNNLRDRLRIGIVARRHGLKGRLKKKVNSMTDALQMYTDRGGNAAVRRMRPG